MKCIWNFCVVLRTLVKIGPNATKDDILGICDILNPHNEYGRLNLIIRMGADTIKEKLPKLLDSFKGEGRNILLVMIQCMATL